LLDSTRTSQRDLVIAFDCQPGCFGEQPVPREPRFNVFGEQLEHCLIGAALEDAVIELVDAGPGPTRETRRGILLPQSPRRSIGLRARSVDRDSGVGSARAAIRIAVRVYRSARLLRRSRASSVAREVHPERTGQDRGRPARPAQP
jgi:hypothetical protein